MRCVYIVSRLCFQQKGLDMFYCVKHADSVCKVLTQRGGFPFHSFVSFNYNSLRADEGKKEIGSSFSLTSKISSFVKYAAKYSLSLRSLVRYRFEHRKINFISPSSHVLSCLLYKPTNCNVFDDFSKISDHSPKVSEDF